MTPTLLRIPEGLDDQALRLLLAPPSAALAAGSLVAFPTETVYGLGADATSDDSVTRIFAAKGRPDDNPLIVHIASAADLASVAVPTPLALRLAEEFWPGPLTLVLQRTGDLADLTVAGLDTVAVRVPDSAIARVLISLSQTPVAAPSANRSGGPSPTTAAHVAADVGHAVSWIIDGGPCRVGIESTVVDARGEEPIVLREGAVTREMLGGAVAAASSERSPGTRHRHYQPRASVRIAPIGRGLQVAEQLARRGGAVGLVAPSTSDHGSADVRLLAEPPDGEALAKVLYASLRRADELKLAHVVVEAVPDVGVGRAVMDRLRRAENGDDPAEAGS